MGKYNVYLIICATPNALAQLKIWKQNLGKQPTMSASWYTLNVPESNTAQWRSLILQTSLWGLAILRPLKVLTAKQK